MCLRSVYMSNSFVWLIEGILLGATTPRQKGPRSNGIEGVVYISQSSNISTFLPLDKTVSCAGFSLGGMSPLQLRGSRFILQFEPKKFDENYPPIMRTVLKKNPGRSTKIIYIYIYMCVCVCVSDNAIIWRKLKLFLFPQLKHTHTYSLSVSLLKSLSLSFSPSLSLFLSLSLYIYIYIYK